MDATIELDGTALHEGAEHTCTMEDLSESSISYASIARRRSLDSIVSRESMSFVSNQEDTAPQIIKEYRTLLHFR
jgi:hypothetical protein